METSALESIPTTLGREDDGRWWADIESMPGVVAYGATRKSAISAVRALAVRVAADCARHGEEIPLTPEQLGLLAKRLSATRDASKSAHLKKRLTRGFYAAPLPKPARKPLK